MIKKIILLVLAVIIVLAFVVKSEPKYIAYGVSFSKFHSDELRLDWKEVYLALLDDLKVRNLRLSAHWPNTEPQNGVFNFSELDFQMQEAQKRNVSVIFVVGRRAPGWPECHDPEWVKNHDVKFRNEELLDYIETTVNRYKKYDNIRYWQVENEPFLVQFARSHCGDLDREFLKQEIELVKKLDPQRPILLTDSGEFGTWYKAYQDGDVFGTSLYLYIWQHTIGPMRYPITPAFFVLKQKLINFFYGPKNAILIEMSTEPWLLQAIVDTPMPVLLDRMGLDKFNEMIKFSKKTGFEEQYLWGAEWWYWMKKQNHPEYWERARELFIR